MRRLNRLTALVLGLLLLAAPAVWAWGEVAPWMACCSDPHAVDISACHGMAQAALDCCAMEPAREPGQATELRSPHPITALEASDLRLGASTTRADREDTAPARSSLLHDLGRYTLFASFLL